MHAAALERFCERVLKESTEIIHDSGRSAHERYLALFRLIEKRDEEMANAFNDMRRSRFFARLTWMRSLGVVTDEEWEGFEPDTRESVDLFLR